MTEPSEDEDELRRDYKRAEHNYQELRSRADDAESDADYAYKKMEEIGEKIAAIEDAREAELGKSRERERREKWLAETPSTLGDVLSWLVREPEPPKSRRIGCLVQGGAAVSNGWAMLHVAGESVPAAAEPMEPSVADAVLQVRVKSEYATSNRFTE